MKNTARGSLLWLLFAAAAARAEVYELPPDGYDVIGAVTSVPARAEDTLLDVLDELAGWQASYDTIVGRKLVRETVIRDVNHPSVVAWNNGHEGGCYIRPTIILGYGEIGLKYGNQKAHGKITGLATS